MRIPEPQGFSTKTEREFDEFGDALAAIFGSFAREGEDFEVYEHSGALCSVDLTIINYEVITPAHVEARLTDIQEILRRYRQFWCIRLWLYKPTEDLLSPDQCIWLEITKYGVAPYRGKKYIEIFEDMDEVYRHYWGRDFALGATDSQ